LSADDWTTQRAAGLAALKTGKLAAAQKSYESALVSVASASKKPDESAYCDFLYEVQSLSTQLTAKGQAKDALALSNKEVESARKVYGDNSAGMFAALIDMASVYAGAGQTDQSQSIYKRAIALRDNHFGQRHGDTITLTDADIQGLNNGPFKRVADTHAKVYLKQFMDASMRGLGH